MGQISSQGCAFIRNIILARELGPSEIGIVATFWIVLGGLAVFTAISTDRFLVQDEEGASEKVVGTIHSLQIIRGVLIACIIFGSSWFAAWLFGNEEALWAYQCLAIIPLLGAFQNANQYVWQKKIRFSRTVLIELIPQIVTLAVTIPVLVYYQNYSAVIVLAILMAALKLVASHVLSTAKYVFSWDWPCICRIWKFSIFLLFSAILMYLGMAGDRIILGATYSRADLGLYATAVVLASVSADIVSKTLSHVGLPILSGKNDQGSSSKPTSAYLAIVTLAASLLAIGMVLIGPFAVNVVYGNEYELSSRVIGILAIMLSVRILRSGIVTVAMSSGDTIPSLIGSIVRTLSLVLVIAGVAMQSSLVVIAALGLIGEVLSYAVVLVWSNRKYKIWNRSYFLMGQLGCGFALLSYVSYYLMREFAPLYWLAIPAVVYSVAFVAISAILIPELRRNSMGIWEKIRS